MDLAFAGNYDTILHSDRSTRSKASHDFELNFAFCLVYKSQQYHEIWNECWSLNVHDAADVLCVNNKLVFA